MPGWAPEYLHPAEPSAEPGTVFRTQVDGEETLWIVLQFDPARAYAAYARMTPGSRIGLVSIQCAEAEPGSTRVTVTYSLTALTSAGHAILSDLTAERFDAMLAEWRNAILRIDPDRH